MLVLTTKHSSMAIEENTQEKEMGLMDHIRDLRSCLVRCSWWVAIFMCIAWAYRDPIYHFLWDPYQKKTAASTKIVYTGIMDPFNMAVNQSIVFGIIFASPFIIYEAFKFISPALKQRELNLIRIYSFLSLILFGGGVYLGYGYMLPHLAEVMSEMQISGTESYLNAADAMTTIIKLLLGLGIVFQFPLVLFFAIRIGLLKLETVSSNRRVVAIIILIISAIASPPDLISCAVIFIPFYALFEITLICCKIFIKNEKEEGQ